MAMLSHQIRVCLKSLALVVVDRRKCNLKCTTKFRNIKSVYNNRTHLLSHTRESFCTKSIGHAIQWYCEKKPLNLFNTSNNEICDIKIWFTQTTKLPKQYLKYFAPNKQVYTLNMRLFLYIIKWISSCRRLLKEWWFLCLGVWKIRKQQAH